MLTYPAETIRFTGPPAEVAKGASLWYARGQNFAVCYARLDPGSVLAASSPDYEYVVGVVEGSLRFETGTGAGQASADAVVIVPPGESSVTAESNATLFRVFAPVTPDLAAKCSNADSYTTPRHNVASFEPWPEPVGGYRLRIYQYADMPAGSRKIFRSRNIMVNWEGHPGGAPRPLDRFTPHSHDDFEQGSLELWGEYIHHLRYPWEADYTAWRPDQHMSVTPPGLTIMPAGVVHTSQGMAQRNCLADIFAPPRLDFSLAGYVYNAAEYPMPLVASSEESR